MPFSFHRAYEYWLHQKLLLVSFYPFNKSAISFAALSILSIASSSGAFSIVTGAVSWLHLNALLVKIIDQVLVGIFNYLTTRSVFQKQEHTMIERANHVNP